ncbi:MULTISPECIES: hypothetical protein [Rhodobacterales]|jgi:hypothetical protein|nr:MULTISPECIES: hypothetical protein [Rhodobacterales]
MSSDDKKNSPSLPDAVALGAVVSFGASRLDSPATGNPTMMIKT